MHPYKTLLTSRASVGGSIRAMNPILMNQTIQGRGVFGWMKKTAKKAAKGATNLAKQGVKLYKKAKSGVTAARDTIKKVPIVGSMADQMIDNTIDTYAPGAREALATLDNTVSTVEQVTDVADRIVGKGTRKKKTIGLSTLMERDERRVLADGKFKGSHRLLRTR